MPLRAQEEEEERYLNRPREEVGMESTVEEILSGQADDQTLSAKSVRAASLTAQIAAIRKRANAVGTALQSRLQEDISAVEWLVKNWLAYRLEAETDKILECVSRAKREALAEAARTLAEATRAWHQPDSRNTSVALLTRSGYSRSF